MDIANKSLLEPTLQVSLITKFATREQQEKRVTLRLKGQNEVIFVGEFEVN